LIFQTVTAKMNLAEDCDLEQYVSRPDNISCSDISAICQEAGMQAVRKNRYVVTQGDFDKAYKIVIKKTQKDYNFYL
jgi:26S proteasome regulatory subunit T3